MNFEYFMREALNDAQKALDLEEVPIGCVIVLNNNIIGRGYNIRNSSKNALGHAEIIAINEACKFIGDWRLEDCTMFVTIEPCAMCSGAILQSRLKTLVYGSKNSKGGCSGSIINILNEPKFNHQVEIINDVLEKETKDIMKKFFKNLRNKKNCQ